MVAPLIVYKASAGSGKTFTLAVEYIKLLIKNPQAYRSTLAVTFTNKATAEMKLRILSQLYGVWRGLDDSKVYFDAICKDPDINPSIVPERAGMALQNILNNYSYFRVGTIDSFFQCVLRNLARELELTANLRVGLNDKQVEEQAVDQLIESLQVTDRLLKWLLKYIMDTINEDRSWNVIWQIKKFGLTIFRDYYKEQREKLHAVFNETDFFDEYTKMLREERDGAAKSMKQIGDSFFEIIQAEGLDITNFAQKEKGICSFFKKLQNEELCNDIINKTVEAAKDDPSKWYAKDCPKKEQIHALVESKLIKLLNSAIEEQPRQWRRYQSAVLTLKHLNQLRLLGSIEAKVEELNKDANRFLLSDTQQFLNALISDSDSPFIFEKIGSQLEHIMIDEFQDTSTVQWKNFKVLLNEIMSHNSSSLIVGDVKQSIYRWRSGDWRLLANIKGEFSNGEQRIHEEPLRTNHRSSVNIIEFNNKFFKEAATIEEVSVYEDVKQEYPEDKPHDGRIDIHLYPSDDYVQHTLNDTTTHISELLSQGVKSKDIAILLRSNSNIALVANHLMNALPDVSLVSDEAFRLDASPAVQIIIQALRFLTHPDDLITRAFLAKAYSGDIKGSLPQSFEPELLRMPLYDLTEHLYNIFNLQDMESQSGYLCAFYDQVISFAGEKSSNIYAFLKEWDTTICAKTIQCPDVDGIRLISIHKSKGLEFDHVIIPFCDWKLELSDVLWCVPTGENFDKLPLAPIDYSEKGMKGTIYEKDYHTEHQQLMVDNLNMLYVAFTRAAKSLYIIGKRKAKGTRSILIEQVLSQLQFPDITLEGMDNEKQPIVFSFGVMPPKEEKHKDKSNDPNPFIRTSTLIPVDIESYGLKTSFKQSNLSKEFVNDNDDDEMAQQSNYIKMGNVLHNVFAHIRTADDIEQALQGMEMEGILYDANLSPTKILDMIRKRMADPRVADWFSPKWKLYNECTILLPNGEERRPDRVMTDGKNTVVIDFKFGHQREAYRQQVLEYMNLLSQMGHQHVTGFLWFVYSNQIIEVV